ncbi:hypothetical protein [Streptomyces sp. NPDC046862]|uniref:hypothetical protein n=1 Tax=Streptomyces sp. NPDC046862 TaxID=3154603 RepID=UPI003452B804
MVLLPGSPPEGHKHGRHLSTRAQQQNHPPRPTAPPSDDALSSVVRTLTAQLAELKQRHRVEVQILRQALEPAQSESL